MPPKQIRIPDLLRASKPTSALGGADVALKKLAGADVASRKLVGSDVVSARGKRSRGIALEGDGAVVEFGNSSTADIVGGDDVALLPERKRARRQIVPTMAAPHSLKSRLRGGEECARKELQSSACKKRDAEVPTGTVSARRRLSSEHGGTGSAVEGSSSAADIGDDEPNSEATGQVTGGDPSTSTSCSAILQGGGVTPEQLRAALSRRLTTENGELQISGSKVDVVEQQDGGSPPSDVAAVKWKPSQTISDVGKADNGGRMPINTRRYGSVAESPSTSAPSSPRASPRQIRTSPRRHLPPKPVADVRAAPSSPKAVLDRGRGGKPLQSSLDGWARVQKGPTPLRNYGSRGSLMAALVLGKCVPPTTPVKSTPTGAVRELGAAEDCEGVSETSRNSAVTEDAPGIESGGTSPRRGGILGWARRVTRHGVKGGMTSPERGPRREGGAVGDSDSPTLLKKAASMRDAEPAVQGVRSSGKLPPK
ncbi:hypothetical protein CBR_g22288 [Chara braunii]|uniref:Uncharacterized protein n=1 Tax=Chara braunii TaxID=69332 RepID=A0A388L2J9_CHABU|nr:hypothetical protein CBR_g22288 [Chara braunii]|eukprot:GBG76540.1 hypothetical protein CBR_g22288 [Chara braunii]